MTRKNPEKTVDPAFVLDVMGVDALPGPPGNKAVEGFAVAGIEKNLQLYGEAWCRGHAKLLYDQLACIERTFGLSGMA